MQGVNYIMTDPQIHSTSENCSSFCGEGNLGLNGMVEFFYSHKCNAVCKALGLQRISLHEENPSHSSPPPQEHVSEGSESELSCMLCGDIFLHNSAAYRKALRENNEVYCTHCTQEVGNRITIKCDVSTCKTKTFEVSQYWYEMKGMETPKTCEACRNPKKKSQQG